MDEKYKSIRSKGDEILDYKITNTFMVKTEVNFYSEITITRTQFNEFIRFIEGVKDYWYRMNVMNSKSSTVSVISSKKKFNNMSRPVYSEFEYKRLKKEFQNSTRTHKERKETKKEVKIVYDSKMEEKSKKIIESQEAYIKEQAAAINELKDKLQYQENNCTYFLKYDAMRQQMEEDLKENPTFDYVLKTFREIKEFEKTYKHDLSRFEVELKTKGILPSYSSVVKYANRSNLVIKMLMIQNETMQDIMDKQDWIIGMSEGAPPAQYLENILKIKHELLLSKLPPDYFGEAEVDSDYDDYN